MALTTIAAARTQLQANLDWDSRAAAAPLALEAVRFLLFFDPISSKLGESMMSRESLREMEARLTSYCQNATATGAANRTSFTRARGRAS